MWVITKDYHADHSAESGTNMNALGMIGPSCVPDGIGGQNIKVHRDAQYFEMYDDDGELYYEGYWVDHDSDDETHEVNEFEPLDDFGTPNAGCTLIKHRNLKTGIMEDI